MITLTIVRHGESTDNVKSNWAGWADAPLSVHGMEQAKCLGKAMKDTKIDAIVASDLKRANWTANQVLQNQADPKPPMATSQLLREQHFGIAEGHAWGKEGSRYHRQPGRSFRFEGGESLVDVSKRANEVIAQFIESELREHHGKPPSSRHIMLVAHGIFNSEFVGALLARRPNHEKADFAYRGMENTAYSRLEVGYSDEASTTRPPTDISNNPDEPPNESSVPSEPPSQTPMDPSLPPLSVNILFENEHRHKDHLERQKGGIGSSAYDEKQQTIRTFFSGGSKV